MSEAPGSRVTGGRVQREDPARFQRETAPGVSNAQAFRHLQTSSGGAAAAIVPASDFDERVRRSEAA